MIRRALPLMAALAATQLSGCVAAAIAPLAATGALGTKAIKGKKKPDPAKPAPTPEVTVGQGVSATPPLLAPAPVVPEPAAAAPMVEAAEAQAEVDSSYDPYGALAAYVLAQVEATTPGKVRTSALLDQRSLVEIPRMSPCADQRGAVLIDLDPGDKAFDLDDPPTPVPGLAQHLRRIRGTGTAVVWIASLPDGDAKRLGTILKATGLDPLGIDQVMLLHSRETRKQQILDRADEDWCVLAIAGDRKADFDEVFDYLRNPDGPVAIALEQFIGAGWFLAPPPIK
ncbi:hypothetical protein [Novosphingobium jiangmenense]|uniref:Uncharacterized protein n=1 Tax=Novosphingobium jiangmenense TaxID=2791981 RepID=A0ABS0HH66_9SPHN|nr:hypothetical protein [Novosphingobium jiangmenense]MBF9151594.1 hypothetical protein [Novosphingobium jiangmenense]